MQRVLIIGSPGAGKSTLSRQVADVTGLPLIHLDREYWQPGWTETPKVEWRAKVTELAARDRWIIDGNYGGSLAVRLARADTVVDLHLPAWLCIKRALGRVMRARSTPRPDMAEGCDERFDLSFLFYIALFPLRNRKVIESRLAGFAGRRVRLRNPTEVRHFVATLAERR